MGRTIGELIGRTVDPIASAVRDVFSQKEDDTATAPTMPLRMFVERGWHVIEPDMHFIPNWHIDAICEHLEWISAGEIQRLVINIPPGHAKSMIFGVLWPAWMWTWRAGWRSIFGSYDLDLSTRDAVRTRMVLTSPWYLGTFEPSWRFTSDQNVKGYYRNSRMGERMAVSVTGKSTGFRGHFVGVDDPLNVRDRHSDDEGGALDQAIDWWDKAMSSRLNDPRNGARAIIMQRLHERDLTGHALRAGGYVHLRLPSEFRSAKRSVTVIKNGKEWADPRQREGELLFPELFTPEVIAQAKKDLGSWDFAAQHQQEPMPASGGIFQRAWFKFYRTRELPHASLKSESLQSWDLTFKKREDLDFVVGDVWDRFSAACYLRYERRDQMGFGETKRAIREVSAAWPVPAKLIEDKANGPAIIEELRTEIPGIIAVQNNDGTLAQAWAIQPYVEAGSVYVPHPDEAPWVLDWLDEVCAFPKGAKDDRVTTLCQAILRLMRNARAQAVTSGNGHQPSEAAKVANERY